MLPMQMPVARSSAALARSPELSDAAPPNRASRATIAFLESDRPDAPRAGDAYGDASIVPIAGPGERFTTVAIARTSGAGTARPPVRALQVRRQPETAARSGSWELGAAPWDERGTACGLELVMLESR